MSDVRPFQRMEDRLAGRPLDRTLYEGVPTWLNQPLREWLLNVLDHDVGFQVALRLRISLRPQDKYSYQTRLHACADEELLTVLDAVLQLHPGWDGTWHTQPFLGLLNGLDYILTNGGSLYRVDREKRHLVRRVGETVQSATDAAMTSAPETAADHLRTAWLAAYGLNPEPDKVFNESIRAVEEVACPLIEDKRAVKGVATLGSVIGELKNSSQKWELVLPTKNGQPSDVGSVVAMMETLWDAQRSRHGGGPNSRRQTKEEAEAAVHLAVLLVQWLSTGALRKRKR